jgi:hypothetical protein
MLYAILERLTHFRDYSADSPDVIAIFDAFPSQQSEPPSTGRAALLRAEILADYLASRAC